MGDHRDRRARLISRVLITLALALGAVGLGLLGQAPRAGGSGAGVEAAPRAKLRFSKHAEQRLRQRGVAREDVEHLVAGATPFSYRHEGRIKQGYYDARTGLFVAAADGVIITVIADATPRYIDKLKRGGRP